MKRIRGLIWEGWKAAERCCREWMGRGWFGACPDPVQVWNGASHCSMCLCTVAGRAVQLHCVFAGGCRSAACL